MKIDTSIDTRNGRIYVRLETSKFTALEEQLICQFGDPLVEVGGTFTGSFIIPGWTPTVLTIKPDVADTVTVPALISPKINEATGAVDVVIIEEAGLGYTLSPEITAEGDGFGAEFLATILPDSIESVAVLDGGTGYTVPPTITAVGPGTGATFTSTLVSDAVGSVAVLDGGAGFLTPPTMVVTGTGTGAILEAVLLGDVIDSVTVVNGGRGYTAPPTVTATGDGVGGSFLSTLKPNSLGTVTVVDGGAGYTEIPTLEVVGTGTGAVLTATMSDIGVLGDVEVVNGGSGYHDVPWEGTFQLPTAQRRLRADFPVQQVFDTADYEDAEAKALCWAETLQARMTLAIQELKAMEPAIDGETGITV